MGIFIPASRNSFSRIFVTVVNLCALVNGGQHLFFLYEFWMVCVCVCFFCRGRSGVKNSDFGMCLNFLWRHQN